MDTRERGFMATQHEEYGDVSERDIVQVYIDEELDVDIGMFSDYNEYLAENHYETWFLFDELNDMLYGLTPTEIIRVSQFGSFSFNDEYISYDGYGNFCTGTSRKTICSIMTRLLKVWIGAGGI